MHALLFKSESENNPDPYVEELSRINLSAKVVPVLQFQFCNLGDLKCKLSNPSIYSGIIFSSPRCVQAVGHCVPLDDKWKELIILAVGVRTSNLIKDLLKLDSCGHDCGNIKSLADFVCSNYYDVTRPFLIPHGNLSNSNVSILTSRLKAQETPVDCIEVYKTIPNDGLEHSLKTELLSGSLPGYIVYFSPSSFDATVNILKENVPSLEDIRFVAIGPTTESYLKEQGLRVYSCAEKPTPESLSLAMKNVN